MKFRSTTLMERHMLTMEGCVQMNHTWKRVQLFAISWATITLTFNTGLKHIYIWFSYSQYSDLSSNMPKFSYICRSINTPIWLSKIKCDNINTPHILRCHTNVTKNAERNDANICGPDNLRLLVKCGKQCVHVPTQLDPLENSLHIS